MNKERRKERRFDEMKQKLTHFLHRRGRRFCATALCVTMLFTNVATSIGSTGDDNDAAEFKITSESLKDALKASVENGEILENEYEFRGTESEAYNGLFEVDGTLYQLKPEIDDDDSKMSLSVYARVYEELVDENGYNITGSEDIIFLLKNDTNKAQKAVIRVDDMVSKVITVAPKSSIQVDGEGPSGDDESSISSGGGGLTAGNSAVSSDGTGIDEESSAAEETVEEKADETEGNISSDTGIENPETNAPEIEADDSGNSESKEEIGNIENSESGKESEDAEVTTPDDSENADSEKESADSGSKNDSGNSSDSSSESDSGNSSGSGSESDSGNNADSGSNSDSGNSSDSGSNSDSGNSSDSGSNSDSGNSSDSGSNSDSGNSADSGSGSDTGSSSDSGSGSDSGSSSDSGSDNDSGSSETASISSHYAVRVMAAAATPSEIIAEKETEVEILNEAEATSSETEEEEEDIFSAASPSEATPSEATVPMDGTYYDAVRLGNNAVVAFVVKAEELGLDDKVFEASLDNVIVRVTADRGVLPNGAELSVTELTETGDTAEQYQEAKAALDEAGTEYSGMMALDICFLDKDGNEVEPDTEAGEVRVTIEMASEFLPEDVDHNTLSVQHLKEKEDGSIEVEQVADAADSTDGTVEKKEEIEEGTTVAEFSVESFSTFTVTWNSGLSTYFSMTVHCVSEDDLDTELTNDTTEYTISLNNTGTVTVPLSDYKKDIAGYIYKEAHFASTTGTVITHLDATISGSNRSVKLYNEENSDNVPYNETYNGTQLKAEIWLVYQKEVVSIIDSISENGLLSAVLTNGATGDGYTLEWYKSETGGSNESDWELVKREKVTGDSYNITENGMAVNVAYDDGARHYYKVKVYDETRTLIGTSSEYFISYYDELQNGGFEEPTVTGWLTIMDRSMSSFRMERKI